MLGMVFLIKRWQYEADDPKTVTHCTNEQCDFQAANLVDYCCTEKATEGEDEIEDGQTCITKVIKIVILQDLGSKILASIKCCEDERESDSNNCYRYDVCPNHII